MFEIGTSLREARHRRGVELVQAEVATKVRAKYLRALEDERFELLPSPTYVKGFLRTYAEYLGLEGQLYVDEYASRFVAEDEAAERRAARRPGSRAAERRNRRFETVGVLAALAVVAAITIVVIGAWTSSSHPTSLVKTTAATGAARIATPHYLLITAVRGSSYLAIHRNGPSGPIVFQGTIMRGHTEPCDGSHFWLTASDPENLTIRVGGRIVSISGSRPVVLTVTPSGWQLS